MVREILENMKKFGISKDIIKVLEYPERVLEVSIPVKTDNGSVEVFKGYRIIYNTLLGPGKGGIRFHPNVTKEEVENLAFWMTIKNSLAGLPYGGAKGGIVVNPKELSKSEVERLSREYIRKVYEFVGVDRDIPAPDVYTDEKIMAIMLDEYEKIARKKEFGMITGKPIVLGGDPIRKYATSLGGFYVLERFLELYELKDNIKTIIIHGFGNVGKYFAKIAYENGYKIIGVADSKGAIYNPNGIDVNKLIDIKDTKGSVLYYEDAKKMKSDEILELEADVLVPASIENVVNKNNVDNINTKIILELANGPIDLNVENKLLNRNVLIIPDILANSGGVIVSHLEWVQNRMGYYWGKDESIEKLKRRIEENSLNVYKISKKLNTDLRRAAYYIAIKRLEEALRYRYFLH